MRYAYFEPNLELGITLEHAKCGSHQGRCDDDIAALRKEPYIAAQLDAITPAAAVRALQPYGAWDAAELAADHNANLDRILWIACGDIVEDQRSEEHASNEG